MDVEIVKSLITGGATVLGAMTVGGLGFTTAKLVTSRLEAQKQKMELYKALYTERIAAAKEITATAELVLRKKHQMNFDDGQGIQGEVRKLDYGDLVGRLSGLIGTYRWLITPEVASSASKIVELSDNADPFDESGTRENLAKAVSDMMLSDDLSRLVQK